MINYRKRITLIKSSDMNYYKTQPVLFCLHIIILQIYYFLFSSNLIINLHLFTSTLNTQYHISRKSFLHL